MGIEEIKEEIFNRQGALNMYELGDEVQLQVKENKKNPGAPIFIREDGKVGFPTFNSIPIDIGEIIKGKIKLDTDTYFFVEVQEILMTG